MPARYNRKVTIERFTDLEDDQGGQTRDWQEIGAAFVRATPSGSSAALVAGTLQQSQPWRIEMRARTDIAVNDRLLADWLPEGFSIVVQSCDDQDGRGKDLVVYGVASIV